MSLSNLIKPGPPLEADGMITIFEIETGKVVAQYEGLEVHYMINALNDLILRIAGYDPDEIGTRMKAAAEQAFEKSQE